MASPKDEANQATGFVFLVDEAARFVKPNTPKDFTHSRDAGNEASRFVYDEDT